MSADNKHTWVKEGDAFAGGILTREGAAEVNGHRARVLNGEPSIAQKILKAYFRDATFEQQDKAKKALSTTPW